MASVSNNRRGPGAPKPDAPVVDYLAGVMPASPGHLSYWVRMGEWMMGEDDEPEEE